MATKFYGVRAQEQATTASAPETVTSGITFAVGTAPVHKVGGSANEIILANDYDEAVAALGYSDNWDKYTLCEVIYSHFKLFGMAPLLLVNVLDPDDYQESVEATIMSIVDGQITLPEDAVADSIVVTDGDTTTYTAGVDYDVLYNDDGACIIEVLDGGAMDTDELTEATVAYSVVSFDLDDLDDAVIGGYDVTTGKSTGLELVDFVYYKHKTLQDILICPGFSHKEAIASVMAAKTEFSTVFREICICDLDASTITNYQDAITEKEENSCFCNTRQVVCWPMVALEDKIFHLSTQIAGQMAATDAEYDNVPSVLSSNKALNADSTVLADGTEIIVDLTQANALRSEGIMTALNFVNGFVSWGSYCGCYPDVSTDPKDTIISQARMFGYVANTVVLTYWKYIDRRLTNRLAESVLDDVNIWLNSLTNDEHLLGARCELLESENPSTDMANGIFRIHIYMTPATPAQEIDFLLEYDVDYASSVLGVGSAD
ncbi:MAG: phage tail protein [Clostridiales bacterium]|nr:phage tail protein [Clostridiales bacterium]